MVPGGSNVHNYFMAHHNGNQNPKEPVSTIPMGNTSSFNRQIQFS